MRLVAIGCVLVASVAVASAKVATPTIGQLERMADAIALVEVVEVHQVLGLDIAEAEVLKGYRGVKKGARIVFLADRTWVCDISHANKGETALVFLVDLPADLRWRLKGPEPDGLDAALLAKFGVGVPQFRIAVSGRGRLLVKKGRVQRGHVRWSFGKSVSLDKLETALKL